MAHSRMAIASLLSSSPPTSTSSVGSGSQHITLPDRPERSLPLHMSLPAHITRRTPSPPPRAEDDKPRPAKRQRSDNGPSSTSTTTARTAAVTSVSGSVTSAGQGQRTSYLNPSFYSPRPTLRTAPDGLEPVPLATFAATTNTELRFSQSRHGSRATSPAGPDHVPSTNTTLLAAVKTVEGIRASLRESRATGKTRHSSVEAPVLPHKPPAVPPPTSVRVSLSYPSSSERDRPASPRHRRSDSSSTSAHSSTASDVYPSPRPAKASPVTPRSPLRQSSSSSTSSHSGTDAHDWLIDHYSVQARACLPQASSIPRKRERSLSPSASAGTHSPISPRTLVEPEPAGIAQQMVRSSARPLHPATSLPAHFSAQPRRSSVDDDLLDLLVSPSASSVRAIASP